MDKNNHISLIANDIICVHKTNYLPRYDRITYHMHDAYEIYLFLDGEVDFYVEGNMRTLKKGDLILLPPYVFHTADSRNSQTYNRAFLNLSPAYLKTLSNESTDLTACFKYLSYQMNVLHLSGEELSVFLSIIDKIGNELDTPSYGHSLLIPALLTQLMVYINQKALSDGAHNKNADMRSTSLSEIMEFINQNIASLPSIGELAARYHYNADYLNRSFKAATGLTLQHYILEKRISLAKQYLSGGKSPGEVCELCGFHDYSNFSRTFRKYTGKSPSSFKDSL